MFFIQPRLEDDSARQRSNVLRDGIELFLKNPLTGSGAGVTEGGQPRLWPHQVSTHNQLAAFGAEYGIVGIAMWVWLLTILVRGRYFLDRTLQTAAILLFVWMTFFTHNMLDFPYWLLFFSLLSSRKTVCLPTEMPVAMQPQRSARLRHKFS
jgi:O-antigen ligase